MKDLIKKASGSIFLGKRVLAGAAVILAIGYVAVTHLLAVMQYVDDEIEKRKGSSKIRWGDLI